MYRLMTSSEAGHRSSLCYVLRSSYVSCRDIRRDDTFYAYQNTFVLERDQCLRHCYVSNTLGLLPVFYGSAVEHRQESIKNNYYHNNKLVNIL